MGAACSVCSDPNVNFSPQKFGNCGRFFKDQEQLSPKFHIESSRAKISEIHISKNCQIPLGLTSFNSQQSTERSNIKDGDTQPKQNQHVFNFIFPKEDKLVGPIGSSCSNETYQVEKLDSEWHDFLSSKKRTTLESRSKTESQDIRIETPKYMLQLGFISLSSSSSMKSLLSESHKVKEVDVQRKNECQMAYELLYNADSSEKGDMKE